MVGVVYTWASKERLAALAVRIALQRLLSASGTLLLHVITAGTLHDGGMRWWRARKCIINRPSYSCTMPPRAACALTSKSKPPSRPGCRPGWQEGIEGVQNICSSIV